jgi:hypothetical protein
LFVDQSQKIAAMRRDEADSHELSMAKSMARLIIRQHGVEAAAPAIEYALGMVVSAPAKILAPKVVAPVPVTIAAAVSSSTELSKRMPHQPAVIPADPRVAAIAEAAISAATKVPQDTLAAISPSDYSSLDPAPRRSTETRYRRPLSGLAGIYAAVHGIGEEP